MRPENATTQTNSNQPSQQEELQRLDITMEERIQRLGNAAINNNLEELNRLLGTLDLAEKAELLTADDSSALKWSANYGHFNIVNSLIEAARGLPNGQDILTQMLTVRNYSALGSAAGNGYINIVNSLIEAARGLTNQDGQNVLAQMLIADNSYALKWAAESGYLNIVDRFLVEAEEVIQDEVARSAFIDRANQEMRSGVISVIKSSIGYGNKLDLNVGGEERSIVGKRKLGDWTLLSFLTLLSNLPENLENNQNRPIGRNDLINSINQQLPENNPLRRFLGAFEEIFRNPAFPNLEPVQNQITNQKLPIISSLFEGHNNQRPMIEQMRGGWSELRELETIINDVKGFVFSNKNFFEDLSEAKKFTNGNLGEERFISRIPADITSRISTFLTGDVNPNIVSAVFDLAKRSNNFINLLAIAEMTNSPNPLITLKNIDQIIARRDLRIAQANSRRNEAEARIEIAIAESANNNLNQEQQNIGENVFYPAVPENYRNNRISVDDTPSPAIRGRTVKRIIDGISAEIKDFSSAIKETFGKCLGR